MSWSDIPLSTYGFFGGAIAAQWGLAFLLLYAVRKRELPAPLNDVGWWGAYGWWQFPGLVAGVLAVLGGPFVVAAQYELSHYAMHRDLWAVQDASAEDPFAPLRSDAARMGWYFVLATLDDLLFGVSNVIGGSFTPESMRLDLASTLRVPLDSPLFRLAEFSSRVLGSVISGGGLFMLLTRRARSSRDALSSES